MPFLPPLWPFPGFADYAYNAADAVFVAVDVRTYFEPDLAER